VRLTEASEGGLTVQGGPVTAAIPQWWPKEGGKPSSS